MKKLLYLLPLLLIGCSSPKEIIREVPVEVVKVEYQTQYVHDSIYVHDSTYIYGKNDTIFYNVYKTKYIQKLAHDTLIVHDTVPKVVTTTEVKTVKQFVWWPAIIAAILALGCIGYFIYRAYKSGDLPND